jgi:hypothetical protein
MVLSSKLSKLFHALGKTVKGKRSVKDSLANGII